MKLSTPALGSQLGHRRIGAIGQRAMAPAAA
jgi:hypothetical protein